MKNNNNSKEKFYLYLIARRLATPEYVEKQRQAIWGGNVFAITDIRCDEKLENLFITFIDYLKFSLCNLVYYYSNPIFKRSLTTTFIVKCLPSMNFFV